MMISQLVIELCAFLVIMAWRIHKAVKASLRGSAEHGEELVYTCGLSMAS